MNDETLRELIRQGRGPIDDGTRFQDFEDMYAECTCGHYKDTEHADGVCEVRGCGCQR